MDHLAVELQSITDYDGLKEISAAVFDVESKRRVLIEDKAAKYLAAVTISVSLVTFFASNIAKIDTPPYALGVAERAFLLIAIAYLLAAAYLSVRALGSADWAIPTLGQTVFLAKKGALDAKALTLLTLARVEWNQS